MTVSCQMTRNSSMEGIEFPEYNGVQKCTWTPGMSRDKCPHQSFDRVKRPQVAENVLQLIGDTPIVKLNRLAKHYGLDCELWAKCEFFNAGGSVKDRIGLRMVEEAENDGRLKPGDTLIEPTSGNTGVGLCMAAAVKGYKMIITLPEKMSGEKVNMMKCLGAEIYRTPTEAAWNSPESHIALALKLNKQIPNSHILDQYKNPANPMAHYEGTGAEIFDQCGGKIDACIMGAGTGGTATGIARKLKEVAPECVIVGVDPIGSILALPDMLNDENRLKPYEVEGIGYDFIPTVLDRNVIDVWIKAGDKESFACARDLLKLEGLMCGGSSGTAIAGALKWIKSQAAGSLKGKRLVVVLPDSSRNYMSKFLDDNWMIEHGFMDVADQPQACQWWSNKLVSALPQNPPVSVLPSTTCSAAVALMSEKNLTQLPVLNSEGKAVGVVTEGNLVSKISSGRTSPSAAVAEVMYKKIHSVTLDTSLGHLSKILDIMPYCFVVASEGSTETVTGILTRIDLLNYISS